jgi:hypothetical protein
MPEGNYAFLICERECTGLSIHGTPAYWTYAELRIRAAMITHSN